MIMETDNLIILSFIGFHHLLFMKMKMEMTKNEWEWEWEIENGG